MDTTIVTSLLDTETEALDTPKTALYNPEHGAGYLTLETYSQTPSLSRIHVPARKPKIESPSLAPRS